MTWPCYSVQTPFILTLHRGTIDTPDIQYVIKGGRVVTQQPPVPSWPIDPDIVSNETVREDDDQVATEYIDSYLYLEFVSFLCHP